ncbi:hypothetical protein OUZ56_003521 [Daphnia magna]|uniref:JmjN domain-containing protein n=1 Tax=Daphnia magna TaxID=35525 RepID=A0ABR0A9D7_9CRUS|nr:hypothetical protein OUZ56_003521 [Daphnia magna]
MCHLYDIIVRDDAVIRIHIRTKDGTQMHVVHAERKPLFTAEEFRDVHNPDNMMPDINTRQLLLGHTMSFTGWHTKNVNLPSINYHLSGKPKYWVVVAEKHGELLKAFFRKSIPSFYEKCRSAELYVAVQLYEEHIYTNCLQRKTWQHSSAGLDGFERLCSIRILEHNGVNLTPSSKEFRDFKTFVAPAFKKYAQKCGAVRITPPAIPDHSLDIQVLLKEMVPPHSQKLKIDGFGGM